MAFEEGRHEGQLVPARTWLVVVAAVSRQCNINLLRLLPCYRTHRQQRQPRASSASHERSQPLALRTQPTSSVMSDQNTDVEQDPKKVLRSRSCQLLFFSLILFRR